MIRTQTIEANVMARHSEIADTKHKGLVEALRFGSGNGWFVAAGGDNDRRLVAQAKVGNHVHDVALAVDGGALVNQ